MEPYRVKNWAVGNEIWGSFEIGAMTAEGYATYFQSIAKAMDGFGKANFAVYESKNKAQAEMFDLLTPEQKDKLQEKMGPRKKGKKEEKKEDK